MEMWRHKPDTLAWKIAERFPSLCADDVEAVALLAKEAGAEEAECDECAYQRDVAQDAENARDEIVETLTDLLDSIKGKR
jgi:hypothetical protein